MSVANWVNDGRLESRFESITTSPLSAAQFACRVRGAALTPRCFARTLFGHLWEEQ